MNTVASVPLWVHFGDKPVRFPDCIRWAYPMDADNQFEGKSYPDLPHWAIPPVRPGVAKNGGETCLAA